MPVTHSSKLLEQNFGMIRGRNIWISLFLGGEKGETKMGGWGEISIGHTHPICGSESKINGQSLFYSNPYRFPIQKRICLPIARASLPA